MLHLFLQECGVTMFFADHHMDAAGLAPGFCRFCMLKSEMGEWMQSLFSLHDEWAWVLNYGLGWIYFCG
jgi:hypothetical protein